MSNTLQPLHEHFEDWLGSLTADQQVFVRKTVASIYNEELSKMLSEILFMRDPIDLQPEQAEQIMNYIESYVVQGIEHDVMGACLAELISEDDSLKALSDIIVKFAEIIEPTDGSTSEYSESIILDEGVDLDAWRKQTFSELASDIQEAFPDESNNIILEVQQKRVLLRAEDLESNLNQGAKIDFGHQNLH